MKSLPPRRILVAMVRQIPGAPRAAYHVTEGSAAGRILKLVRQRRIDLVVVAAEGTAAGRRLVRGSLAETLAQALPIPVLTV